MPGKRVAIPEAVKLEIIARCNNRCCVCQTPFVHIHHLDGNPSNNEIENLAPLCPNCHAQAHSNSQMTINLTPQRIRGLRDKWYAYCETRRDASTVGANAMLKLKNFVPSMGLAQYSWKRTFADVDPAYEDMTREGIINHAFATSNRDDLLTYLETVKQMYQVQNSDEDVVNRFSAVCNAFGIDYDDLG